MFGWEHQKFSPFCLAHLFTYQSFPGKLGLAYIASWRPTDLGGMCSPGMGRLNLKHFTQTITFQQLYLWKCNSFQKVYFNYYKWNKYLNTIQFMYEQPCCFVDCDLNVLIMWHTSMFVCWQWLTSSNHVTICQIVLLTLSYK